MKKIKGVGWRLIFFPLMIIYMEYYFRLCVYGGIDINAVYPLVLGGAAGAVLALLTLIFKKVGNAVVSYALTVLITVIYIAQLVYYKIFGTFFGLTAISGVKNAMDFKSQVFQVLGNERGYIFGMLIPLLVLLVLGALLISFERPSLRQSIVAVAVATIAMSGSILSLNIGGRGLFSPYSIMHDSFIMDLSVSKLGVPVTTVRDAYTMLFDNADVYKADFNYDYVTAEDTDEYGYRPQIDEEIDLELLYEGTDDKDKKLITAYVSNQEPTYENEYTGMFEGYNLIFITAESLGPYIVREDWTPMLYKMMNEGFVFNNYYNPTWNKSTIDGEFVNCLSQYPSVSRWSLYDSADTYQPYALGNALGSLGYTSIAYHDYDAYFYDRSETHTNMGYEFKAIENGLKLPSQDKYFSDVEMMQVAYEEFSNEEPFNIYFMTYSGHLPYSYDENPISAKNQAAAEELTADLLYNDTVRAYVAAQLELEYALEYLVEQLEEDGILDNTLFVISPDHFPYVMRTGDYDILAQEDIIEDKFKLYHSCFGIWNSNMKEPVVTDKICSSVDILPTVLNLMGVNYDSRMLMGRDILYDEPGSASMPDCSYIDEDICYDVEREAVLYSDAETEKEKNDEVYDRMNAVMQSFSISDKIIETDYFGYVYGR